MHERRLALPHAVTDHVCAASGLNASSVEAFPRKVGATDPALKEFSRASQRVRSRGGWRRGVREG
jgi:hypothetical protein